MIDTSPGEFKIQNSSDILVFLNYKTKFDFGDNLMCLTDLRLKIDTIVYI